MVEKIYLNNWLAPFPWLPLGALPKVRAPLAIYSTRPPGRGPRPVDRGPEHP